MDDDDEPWEDDGARAPEDDDDDEEFRCFGLGGLDGVVTGLVAPPTPSMGEIEFQSCVNVLVVGSVFVVWIVSLFVSLRFAFFTASFLAPGDFDRRCALRKRGDKLLLRSLW